ncbi:FixH family protein [Mesorhizobium sangaii]|nr:FixH family protein [Mesorhizobium sangaii]
MPALILAFFATIIVNLTMAVFASRSWPGFVEELLCGQLGIQSQAEEGRAQAALGWSGPRNRKCRDPLQPDNRNGKKLKPGGVRRTMIRAWR